MQGQVQYASATSALLQSLHNTIYMYIDGYTTVPMCKCADVTGRAPRGRTLTPEVSPSLAPCLAREQQIRTNIPIQYPSPAPLFAHYVAVYAFLT